MGFPKAIADAQRQSLHADVLELLDLSEAMHRKLGMVDAAHLVALKPDELSKLQGLGKTAYETLAAMQKITDSDGS